MTRPETERRYQLSVYFDRDNPSGQRLLYGKSYLNYIGKYTAEYDFQICPSTGSNLVCEEYPSWKSPDCYDTAEEAFAVLCNAIEEFERTLAGKLRLGRLQNTIAEKEQKLSVLNNEWMTLRRETNDLINERAKLTAENAL